MRHVGGDAIEVEIRSKAFRAPTGEPMAVLDHIAFTLRPREVLAVFGPSGVGKTTLLRIVAGLDADFEGRVRRPPDAKVGVVFQEPRLLPWRDVETNIRIAAPELPEKRFRRLVAALGIAEHLTYFPRRLSLGLARRVALARVLAIDPTILIMDEPFASLDAPLARKLKADLSRMLADSNAIAIFSTHDEADAADIATRVLVLAGKPARVEIDAPVSDPGGDPCLRRR
jgi:NitT/TauT family transport system ATP-binding protein